jgi:hypothetical protein
MGFEFDNTERIWEDSFISKLIVEGIVALPHNLLKDHASSPCWDRASKNRGQLLGTGYSEFYNRQRLV